MDYEFFILMCIEIAIQSNIGAESEENEEQIKTIYGNFFIKLNC